MSSALLQRGSCCRTREFSQNFEPHPLFDTKEVNCSESVNHNRVQMLGILVLLLACYQDWTCNLQMIVSQKLREPMPITVALCVLLDCAKGTFGTYKLKVLTSLLLLLLCMIFYLSSFYDCFFLSNLFDYWFPYCIHLYNWSSQKVTVAQHMCWFLMASNVLLCQLF